MVFCTNVIALFEIGFCRYVAFVLRSSHFSEAIAMESWYGSLLMLQDSFFTSSNPAL
ncbi:hypothetical protein QUB80_34625 [Chlorogloeopsis sp. ULAP01]|uniref:hypothetical protein n=1 Tax=Chlorogloeopsis sp. ULAP01 TaxID=3056483 RepID=UPI0025AAF720|nr:hypothetical protein [Chlorogloeopsis sp. ULAP01]MDM9385791.1 hypothetical protein [Chlorogloeopsis sp. ULAP01]